VADASLPAQRVVGARLADLPAAAAGAGLSSPATVIVEVGAHKAGEASCSAAGAVGPDVLRQLTTAAGRE
jgi:hypothetical protein